jgi:hypothetical protein
MEEIHSPGSSFLFVSGAPRLPVLAACRTALSLLSATVASIRGGGVELGSYVSDAGAAVRALLAAGPAGGVVALRAHSGRAMTRVFMRARAQEVRVPHLDAPLYIVRLRHATAADMSAAALAGSVLGLAPAAAPASGWRAGRRERARRWPLAAAPAGSPAAGRWRCGCRRGDRRPGARPSAARSAGEHQTYHGSPRRPGSVNLVGPAKPHRCPLQACSR